MRRMTIGLVGPFLGFTASAEAQVLDHLQCFKVKDPAAKLLCVDTRKDNVRPTPPGAQWTTRGSESSPGR